MAVRCGLALDQQQCDVVVARGQLAAHRDDCAMRVADCEAGCGAVLSRRQAAGHRCVPHLAAALAAARQDLAATRGELFTTRGGQTLAGPANGDHGDVPHGVTSLTARPPPPPAWTP